MTIDSETFHQLAMDYRGAINYVSGNHPQIAYEALVAHIDAQMERDRKDAEARLLDAVAGIISKHFGDSKERALRVLRPAIDAELAKNKKEIDGN